MEYKILIGKCNDPHSARNIAREISRWAGTSPETVLNIITKKTVCIRKKAVCTEAVRLKAQYEALGANVDLVPINGSVVPPILLHAPSAKPAPDDDEEEETGGRLLTDAEYARKLRERNDIFYFEGSRRLQYAETVCLVCAIITGMFLSTREIAEVARVVEPDFYQREVRLINGPVEPPPPPVIRKTEPETVVENYTDRKILQRSRSTGSNGKTGGGGDTRARVTKVGLLGIIAGEIKGRTLVSADIFGKGGFTSDIDAILSGLGGLESGGSGGVGRKGVAGIGYGPGYYSGLGGEGGLGGIEDLIGLSGADIAASLALRTRPHTVRISPPTIANGGALTGGRSKASIARVVMQNLAVLRHAYNKRLRGKPGLRGRITIKFAIDEFGNVIFCQLEESTMSDAELELAVVDKIRLWKFEKIDKPGDVTEVVYPFMFSQ